MKKLPIGIQDFEKLRQDNCLYIDKTSDIARMISTGYYYFLSRPRRFGKSLLLSTIKAFFLGKKELFDGTIGQKLALADYPGIKWEKHPVLHIDLNTQKYDCVRSLDTILNEYLITWENIYGKNEVEESLGRRFQGVIRRAAEQTGQKAVILIDEYDKPLLQAIDSPELQEEFRDTLKGFYGALKSMDGYIQFALLTGVARFGKVSIFSDLNNLNDISMDIDYWNICGISEKELKEYFKSEIETLANANKITIDECITTLRKLYDGYHFEESAPGIYNPFSVLNTFYKRKFGSYWFETGTPTYLVRLIQKQDLNLQNLAEYHTSSNILSTGTNPISVIYQSGYLTIKDYDPKFKIYTLGFPNKEVEEGFLSYLIP